MEIKYVFTQKRKFFGAPCKFSDVGPQLLVDIRPNKELLEDYVFLPKIDKGILCRKEVTRHEVNTVTASTESRGMNHEEGGWPADVDHRDEDQVARFKKKIEKDESYNVAVRNLADLLEKSVMENNSIDIYEEYFPKQHIPKKEGTESLRILNVYKDNTVCNPRRLVADVSWSIDGRKLACAYVPEKYSFSPLNASSSLDCYVWDIENPSLPLTTLEPDNPLLQVSHSPRNADHLIGGYDNGQIVMWDLREGGRPVCISDINYSHLEPVTGIKWLHSKGGTKFLSVSKDGQIFSWDSRNLTKPTEIMKLDPSEEGCSALKCSYSITSLDYDITLPFRFMLGTDEGSVFTCNRRWKEPSDKIIATYETRGGPVLAVERNPFLPKLFAVANAFSVMLWSEDNLYSPLISLDSSKGYVTDITWCRSRPSVLFITRTTGKIEAWNIVFYQSGPVASLKLDNNPLTCISALEHGEKLVCGSQNGYLYLLQMPKSYGTISKKEKTIVAAMVERELKREQLVLPVSREQRLRDLVAHEAAVEEQKLKESLIPPSWVMEDIGEEAYAELNKLEFGSGFLDKQDLEDDELRRAESVHVEEETGETQFLEGLERDVKSTELMKEILVDVVTKVEADNTSFPYQEIEVEEEFGEQAFLDDLEREGTSVRLVDKIIDDLSEDEGA